MSSLNQMLLGHYYDSSEQSGLNIVVVGANGGIGRAMVDQLASDSKVERIYCCSRSEFVIEPNKKLLPISLDICDELSISSASEQIAKDKHPIDIILVCTGLLHDETLRPEKALKELDSDNFLKLMMVNALGPALVAKYFLPLVSKDRRSFFGVISARVGSISDNYLGGWHSYRASKAALNMLVKNIAIEYKRKRSKLVVAGLHPGTVNTSLSLPFQKNVKEEKLFSPDFSSEKLLTVINGLSADDSGLCFAWDGQIIPS